MVLFEKIDKDYINKLISFRGGEVKLGECVSSYDDFELFQGKFVVLGVCEDVGPQANLGFAGSVNGFTSFLARFLNIQSNRFLTGDQVLVYGIFTVNSPEEIDQKRKVVQELDNILISHLEEIYEKGFIPILVGGGHNNAYPLISAFYKVNSVALNVLNCDPHADYRLLEGRHSGNSFSYAKHEGSLNYYNVLGLHQSYNSEEMLVRMEKDGCDFTFFDDYIKGSGDLLSDVNRFVLKNKGSRFGVELDMDAIKGMPSSAYSFSGITVEDARRYIIRLSEEKQVAYLHLPEGAPLHAREDVVVGKTLAYLVSDFIKGVAG
jgi:formiminoglutamase